MKKEILQEYYIFLKDTNKKDTFKNWNEFKNEYIGWYIDMFGIEDERTQNTLEELNSYNYTYQKQKEKTRNVAIEWQHTFFSKDDSYYNIMTYGEYFYKNGKRYGLLREFKENGIL